MPASRQRETYQADPNTLCGSGALHQSYYARRPYLGGILNGASSNDDKATGALIRLHDCRQLHVLLSGSRLRPRRGRSRAQFK
jgi:hypothetical protein